MAHFARVNDQNYVEQVIALNDSECIGVDGKESETLGAAFCERIFGGRWIQTSYNGRIRKNFAGIGYQYREDLDAFIPPAPGSDWILDETTCQWQAPNISE